MPAELRVTWVCIACFERVEPLSVAYRVRWLQAERELTPLQKAPARLGHGK